MSGRSATLLQQWPVGLAAAVATGGADNGKAAMTVHELTAASAAGTMPLHHLGRSRFMITDILSDNGRSSGGGGNGSPVSPASSTDGPRDLSLHGRASSGSNGGMGGLQGPGPAGGGDSDLSDDHESGTDSGLPGDNSSVCSNGKSTAQFTYNIIYRCTLYTYLSAFFIYYQRFVRFSKNLQYFISSVYRNISNFFLNI